jgi:hypothetical protein
MKHEARRMAEGDTMQMRPEEKRAHTRLPVSLTAHCRLGNRYVREPVADLSLGGLLLKTREPVREGTPVRVAVSLPMPEGPRICTLAGTVTRVQKDPRGLRAGVGVYFDAHEIGPVDHTVLNRYLNTIERRAA